MNKEIMYANKKYVVIDDNKNISNPKVFTDNTLDILRLENEKEKVNQEIISLENEIKKINYQNIETTNVRIIRMLIDFLTPFVVYATLKTYYASMGLPIDIPLILGSLSALVIYPLSVSHTKKQIKYKKDKESLNDLIRKLSKDKVIIKKLDTKIKELNEEALVTRNYYQDFDIIDVETKDKIKTRVLKK